MISIIVRSKVFFVASFVILSVIGGYTVFAQGGADISYPVPELENCENEESCYAYCENPDHMGACVEFAERHDLMSEEEVQKAKAFLRAGQQGPGQCKNQEECEAYCSDVSRIDECLAFAERMGMMTDEEIEEGKKISAALKSGAHLPGQCKNKEECEAYCGDSSHMKECIEFAEQAGFMSHQELQEAKQILKAFEAGVQMPGSCRGKQECEAYCAEESHMEECFNFAIAAGFIPPEEAEQARTMMSLMAQGGMPGNCRNKEQCEAYCADESHAQECADAFVKAGFMSEEEKEMFLKTGGKGPGGCKGKDECEAFCNDSANQETCFQFGKEHGLISEEDLVSMEEGMKQAKQGLESAPPEVASCLQEKVGADVLEKIRSGQFTPNSQIGEAMKTCFEEHMPQGPPPGMEGGEGMPDNGGQFQGPGGCASQEECQEYCRQNPEQCGGVMPPREGSPDQGFMPPQGEGIPGVIPFDDQYRQEYEEQYRKQYEEQYKEQYEQGYQQFPLNSYEPSNGSDADVPSGESASTPPSFVPPPEGENPPPPPPGGSVLDAILYFLRVLIP